MRTTFIGALVGGAPVGLLLLLFPAASFAQSGPGPQTAAVDVAAASPAAPSAGGITRDQYIQRAKDRAEQRAASRFDQMDADHDGVLDRAEIRAWRSEHPRRSRNQAGQPSSQ